MKHFGLIQSEFEKVSGTALSSVDSVDTVQLEFIKAASDSGRQLSDSQLELLHHIAARRKKVNSKKAPKKKFKKRTEKVKEKKSLKVPTKETARSFIEEVGDKEVKNPDPKGKKPTVKIKSLKSGEPNSPQRRMYDQLYQQWLKSQRKKEKPKDKKVEKVKDKIERAKKDLKKKKPQKKTLKDKIDEKRQQIIQRLEAEKLEKLKQDKKQPEPVKEEPKPVAEPVKEELVDPTKKTEDTAKPDRLTSLSKKREDDYQKTIQRVKENAPKLSGSVSMLRDPVKPLVTNDEELKGNLSSISDLLKKDNIRAEIDDVSSGPVFTTFHLKVDVDDLGKVRKLDEKLTYLTGKGVKVIDNLQRRTIDIEIPNNSREMVTAKELLVDDDFIKDARNPKKMPIIVGKDKTGKVLTLDLNDSRTPQVLIVGQTGAGKTILIHQIVASVMYGKKPDEAKMIILDPKGGAEFGMYDGSPYLKEPIAKNPKDSVDAVRRLHEDMEKRYALFEKVGVNNINAFNALVTKAPSELTSEEKQALDRLNDEEHKPIEYVTLIADELSDLMDSKDARKELIEHFKALGRKSRASGIHMVVGTQRPGAQVIPNEIQANLPAKIIMKVNGPNEAKYVDTPGAEKLLGNGDLILKGIGEEQRVQSGFIDVERGEASSVAKEFGGSGQVRKEVAPVTEEKAKSETPAEFAEFRDHMKKTRDRLEERRKQLDEMLQASEAKNKELAQKRREIEERGREEEARGSELADAESERELMIEPTDTEELTEEPEKVEKPTESSSKDEMKAYIDAMTAPKPVTKEEVARLRPEERKKSLWDRLKQLRGKV